MPAFVARGYRVITYDRLGSGRSRLAADAAAGTAADDLEALATQLGLTRFHLVGTAAGGIVALDYAMSYPQRVRGLVIANSIGGVQDDDYLALGRRLRPSPQFDQLPPEFREVGPVVPRRRSCRHRAVDGDRARQPAAGGRNRRAAEQESADLRHALESLRLPTLLITGGADLYAPPPVMRMFAARIRGAETVVFPEAGHSGVLGGRRGFQPCRAGVPGQALTPPTPDVLQPSIVGSLPKPAWLAEPNVLRAPWRLSGAALAEAQDDAVRIALLDQEEAGLAVVTDGEMRRRHYIWGFLDGLDRHRHRAADQEAIARRPLQRGDRGGPAGRSRGTPRAGIRGRVPLYPQPHHEHLKVTLPGPMTVADSVADEAGDADFQTLAMRFAKILNAEARDLVEAGADIVQFDEPCFNIYLEEVSAWGIEALETAMDGVAARRAVHICYGYGTPVVLKWKQQNSDWGHYGVTLPLLAKSSVNQVSVETAASGVDVAVLAALAGKDVLVGVVDVGTDEVEPVEVIAQRIRRVLPYVDPAHLHPCTDCGLVPRTRLAAVGKMRALARAAALVRAEVQAGRP